MATTDGWVCVDGNEAAARVAHRLSEVIAIYPITPASTMGELADTWSAAGRPNLWGQVPEVVELQIGGGGGRGAARGGAEGGAGHHLHRLPGPAADAAQHVQDRRRADPDGHPRGRPHGRHPRPVDLRRPLRRDGCPPHRLGDAGRQLGAGGPRFRLGRARGRARLAGAVPAFLRRLPHLPRGGQDPGPGRRGPARPGRRRRRGRPPRPWPVPGPAPAARLGPEPGRVLPGPRGDQPLLRRRARDRAGQAGHPRRPHRPPLRPGRLRRRPRRRAGAGADGLGRGGGRRGSGGADRGRGAGRPGHRAPVPAVPGRGPCRGAPAHCPPNRGAGPDQGAGGDWRAAVPGRGHRPGRAGRRRRRTDADGGGRPLRSGLQGVHPGDGQGGAGCAGRRAAPQPLHRRDRRRRLPHQPASGRRVRHRGPRRAAGGVLRARVRWHRGGQQDVGEDHRRGHRPVRSGLLRARLQEVRVGDRLPPADRVAADSRHLPDRPGAGHLHRLPPVPLPGPHGRARPGRPRRDLPAQQPLAGRPGLGPPARRGPARDHRQAASTCGWWTPPGWPATPAWATGSTRSCSPASSPCPGCCPATRRSRPSRPGSRRPSAAAARRWWPATSPPSTAPWRRCTRWRSPPGRPAPAIAARPCPRRRPTSSSGSRPACWRATATFCRSAPCPWTAPSRPGRPSGRSGRWPPRSPSGTRRSASTAASAPSSARTRPSAPRCSAPRRWRVPRTGLHPRISAPGTCPG